MTTHAERIAAKRQRIASTQFCKVCRGLTPTCMICGRAKEVREKFPNEVAHAKYIRDTWLKLKKYRILTSGVDRVDWACYQQYGPWIKLSDHDWLIRVVLHICDSYDITFANCVKLVEQFESELFINRRKKLNAVLAKMVLTLDQRVKEKR